MVVVAQHFLNSAFAADVHRNTVGQTVAFVGAFLLELNTLEKKLVRDWNDFGIRIG